MQVSYKITDEFKEKYLSIDFDEKRKSNMRKVILLISIALIIFALIALYNRRFLLFTFPTLISLPGIYIAFLPKTIKRKYIEKLDPNEKSVIKINEDHLTISGSGKLANVEYSQIKDLKIVGDYFVVIVFNDGNAALIPNYAFTDNSHRDNYVSTLRNKIDSQKS